MDQTLPAKTRAAKEPSAAFSSKTAIDHIEGLLGYSQHSVQEDEEFHFMRFEHLQRVNIAALQLELVQMKDEIRTLEELNVNRVEQLRSTMEQYCTAIRNYHFLRQRRSLNENEANSKKLLLQKYFGTKVNDLSSFDSHYSSFDSTTAPIDDLRLALMTSLPAWLTYSRNERASRKREFAEGKAPKEVSAFVDRLCRFLIAAVGGLFLVGPMLIMAIDSSTKKSLITVSASVLLFIAVLTFGVRVSNVEALVSTATYAAVLVVFVGTSTGSSDGVSQ